MQVRGIVTGVLAVALAASTATQSVGAASGETIVTGFSFSESVVHDVSTDRYLVSNTGNPPGAPAAPGYISAVKPNGQVLNYKWIDGANASTKLDDPLGMAIYSGKLYVADINKVRVFNVLTGKHITDITIPGATSLNDVASYWGGVYVSNLGLDIASGTPSGTGAIYNISGVTNQVSTLASGPQLNFPNGLLYDPVYGLLVGSVGSATVKKANIFTGSLSNFVTLPTVGVDGITKLGSSFYFSNPSVGVVYRVTALGAVSTVASGLVYPTDIGADVLRNRLLIPQLPIGTLVIKQL